MSATFSRKGETSAERYLRIVAENAEKAELKRIRKNESERNTLQVNIEEQDPLFTASPAALLEAQDVHLLRSIPELIRSIELTPGADGRNGKDGQSIRGETGPTGRDGKDGKTPVKGVDYFDGEPGRDGKKGDKGDGASFAEMKGVANSSVKTHEEQYAHSLIDPFLIGTKKLTEEGMKDGDFIKYDADRNRLIYSAPKEVAAQIVPMMPRGFSLPSQVGNSGKYLTTDGSAPSWATVVGGSGDVATDAIWDAKGDLAVGTGANTAARLAVGTNGQVLTADSAEATGLKWSSAGGSGITRTITSISSPTTAGSTASTDYVYFISGTTTLTMPTAVGNSNRYSLKNTGVNTVTIATTAAQTIDGSSTASLPVENTSLDLISDNSNWRVV